MCSPIISYSCCISSKWIFELIFQSSIRSVRRSSACPRRVKAKLQYHHVFALVDKVTSFSKRSKSQQFCSGVNHSTVHFKLTFSLRKTTTMADESATNPTLNSADNLGDEDDAVSPLTYN